MKTSRKAYPSDLLDEEWQRLENEVPAPLSGGRIAEIDRREIINAILYVSRSGVQWRMLPHDLPNWSTVYHYYWVWYKSGVWQHLLAVLTTLERVEQGRKPQPTAGVIDSQSVKTTEVGGERGYDSAKKVKGRKRHLLVDTLGLILMVSVSAASLSEAQGARRVLSLAWWQWTTKRLQLIWADAGYYQGRLLGFVSQVLGWTLAIVHRPSGSQGFVSLAHRWVVERTFGWLNRYRRLAKDFERQTASSEAQVQIAMISLLRRRQGKRKRLLQAATQARFDP